MSYSRNRKLWLLTSIARCLASDFVSKKAVSIVNTMWYKNKPYLFKKKKNSQVEMIRTARSTARILFFGNFLYIIYYDYAYNFPLISVLTSDNSVEYRRQILTDVVCMMACLIVDRCPQEQTRWLLIMDATAIHGHRRFAIDVFCVNLTLSIKSQCRP